MPFLYTLYTCKTIRRKLLKMVFGNSMLLNSYGLSCVGGGSSYFIGCNSRNTNSIAGYCVGTILGNMLPQIISSVVPNKEANSTVNYQAQINDLDKNISAKLQIIGASENDYNNKSSILSTCEENVNIKESIFDIANTAYNNAIDAYKSSYDECLSNYRNYINPENTDHDDEKAARYKAYADALQNNLNTAERAKKDAEQQLQTAQQEYVQTEARVGAARQEVEQLINQRNELQNKVDNITLDNADGTRIRRTSSKKLDEMLGELTENMDGSYTARENASYDNSDLRAMINRYAKTTDASEKKALANQLKTMYETIKNAGNDGKIKSNIQSGIMLIFKREGI